MSEPAPPRMAPLIVVGVAVIACFGVFWWAQEPAYNNLYGQAAAREAKAKSLIAQIATGCGDKLCLQPDVVINRTPRAVWVSVDNKQGYFHVSDAKHGTKQVPPGDVIWSCMDASRFKALCGR